jgi:hypothetical protein
MRTATARKLIKEAGLTFSTQDERWYDTYAGNFWFLGESRMFRSRARFYLIKGEPDDKKLDELANYLISKDYETQISNDYVEITNLNEDGEL